MKKLLKRYLEHFVWFYNHLSNKLLLCIALSVLVGFLDGMSLTMFLPLLKVVSNSSSSLDGLNSLDFLVEWINAFQIEMSFTIILILMVTFFTLKGIVKFIFENYVVNLQQFLLRQIRLQLLEGINKISYNYYLESDIGQMQNTLTGEIDRIKQAFEFYFKAFEQLFLLTVYLIFAFFIDYKFAFLISIGGLFIIFLFKIIHLKTKNISLKFTNSSNLLQSQIIQYILNFKYLHATGVFEVYSNIVSKTILEIEFTRKKMGFLQSILISAREPIIITIVAVVMYLQINVFGGNLAPIILSLLFFYRALTSLTAFQNNWNKFIGLSGSMINLRSFKEDLNKNKLSKSQIKYIGFKKFITLTNVNFSYGEKQILKDLSLTIKKNESIAFVGKTGSGKTTLVNIISGLLSPNSGSISIDNQDLSIIDKKLFQKRIGYITQEPVIFNDTLYNNITLWDKKNEDNIKLFNKVISQAILSELISQMPKKENTILGNNGVNLSGGQRQRISIARELYKKIDLLIMDESTSSLDSDTEFLIKSSIDSLKNNITLIIIAHRLSTIESIDKVYMLKNGILTRNNNNNN